MFFWCYMYSIVFPFCSETFEVWNFKIKFYRCWGTSQVDSSLDVALFGKASNLLWWSMTLLVQHIQWNQFLCAVHTNSFEKNIAKLFHWWRSMVVTKYKASPTLRSCVLHFCLPHLHREPQSFDHVINVDAWPDPQIMSWQPTFKQDEHGWIHPTIRDTACLMNLWWTFKAKLLVRESIKLLAFLTQLVHCKLQERPMCTFHFRAKHEPHRWK